jgi:transposase
VAVIDAHGRAVDDVRVEANARGYREVLAFLARWADVVLVGVECTGSYGAGVTRALTGRL